ncbi:MAG: UDP-N-acetylmuramate dehydrogenase [Ignavibacteria bacterium]|nr:UDP-N-acetylmuramate dehydrogenase [Ignavibacteria bacterium]
MPEIEKNILLAPHTAINLGGKAKYFTECQNESDLIETLQIAKDKNLKFEVIGEGSNVIFQDEGYNGLIIKLTGENIEITDETDSDVLIKVWAGTNWNKFVEWSVNKGYQGIECLSGIPGSTGATPVQNLGAYGQEVSSTIVNVICLDRNNFRQLNFSGSQCRFDYRNSIFKNELKGRYIISYVVFKLSKVNEPEIKYSDLISETENSVEYNSLLRRDKRLEFIRNKVIDIRRRKSMLSDDKDTEAKSCGSFFKNPVLTFYEFNEVSRKISELGFDMPFYKFNDKYKIPAAFLIERAGFEKGYTKNGAGISKNHTLALVNRGCTTKELLELADEISNKVYKNFRIKLNIEPIIIK